MNLSNDSAIRHMKNKPIKISKIIKLTNLTAAILATTLLWPSFTMGKEPSQTVGEEQPPTQDYIRTTVNNYFIPDVDVIRMDNNKLSLINALDDGRPVMMNFIFASCSAICPMLSHTFMQVQKKLGKESQNVHLVSISIDPENDTPAVLQAYAKKFQAGSQWDFYTGKLESSVAIQKAFNVYRGDKMNHSSVILMRAKPGKPWFRLEGFASPQAVMDEYRTMLENSK
ncbi:MAG: SCO family protein [Methylococcaceae bacterium]|nr:SCO family protein [Methylococcaceae bacterium]